MPDEQSRSAELTNPGYELFIVGLFLISLGNFVIAFIPVSSNVHAIAEIMDIAISVIFLIDFAKRLLSSHPRRAYFVNDFGWLDLLGSLPFAQVKIFRAFRVIRVARVLRKAGGRRILAAAFEHRADNALLTVVLLVIVLLEFGSMSVLGVEQHAASANIKTGGDALWWAFVSITTVGYGDYYPVTTWGRTFAILVLAAGVGLFGVLSGFLANFFLTPTKQRDTAPGPTGDGLVGALDGDPLLMLDQLEAQFQAQVAAIRAILTNAS